MYVLDASKVVSCVVGMMRGAVGTDDGRKEEGIGAGGGGICIGIGGGSIQLQASRHDVALPARRGHQDRFWAATASDSSSPGGEKNRTKALWRVRPIKAKKGSGSGQELGKRGSDRRSGKNVTAGRPSRRCG
uniref:Uncharacterized protein n=1 Tax=Pseudictyota dubia TaxID=2749911 RepID=A0A7R9VCV3_9STRA|mmetsp:Transcript_11183/g.21346  ORF Transcript_11183/g.21346 Transcript_11183/m.21346 type:complete len:132 (+) Transcript_11183:74-469(+)